MANRPGTLCTLQPGKAIGGQSNFASTFNWIVSCLKNLRAGKGVKVTWPASDTPEISVDGEGGNDGGGGGGGGGGGESSTTIAFVGTDQSQTRRDKDFIFLSANDSNVTVTCDENSNVITLGVYYT